ncbi:peptidoglycan-associated lipoprotein Pal [Melaminivora jejuensis]|uniref:peptidoglycan-associated lipoprotein Pal n=1 Tax=Melaminivora jejuensis TaxID=1267217 RepID=UPI001ADECEDB|nr:peptidoglycan-associated lipoprotein Pal [Melaminivora jejuensis]UHJ66216.1 peptidoglycan-associated lipoprotein Pal [Melaminivora jejuensis]
MIQFSLKRTGAALAIVALVAGCSSGVKLDDVPVEDRGATSTMPAAPGADAGSMGQSGVAPVDLTQAGQGDGGPVGVARIIYFDFDSYAVRPEYQSVLEGHARFLKAAPGRKVMIEGHTDERGGREYNLALGQKRAEAVRRSLALLGVTDVQMEAVSFGKEKPAVSGFNEDAYSQNRRAELSYR